MTRGPQDATGRLALILLLCALAALAGAALGAWHDLGLTP